jgi:predicted nucleic acid-binding protein
LVISDSSTLIHLACIGQMSLLRDLFGRIVIPLAVRQEVVDQGAGRPGSLEVAAAIHDGWIEVVEPASPGLVAVLRRQIGGGEAETLALAIERNAELVLLDESAARRVAESIGLAKTGVVGIVLRADRQGRLANVVETLTQLRNSGFWIDDRLFARLLDEIDLRGQRP